jgi:CBS domain-containing protein
LADADQSLYRCDGSNFLIRTGVEERAGTNTDAEATMFVKEAMTSHAEWVAPDLTLTEVARRMRDNKIGCLPVGEKDRLVGMITDRDIACRAVANGSDPAKTKARDVMTKGITYCFDDQTLEEALHMMADKGVHHLPVLNRSKRMIGILALGDVALKGAPGLSADISKLASRDASRHAGDTLPH